MAERRVASPGHKLGQQVGVILQQATKELLEDFAARFGLYCDSSGPRPGVRAGTKVTWTDNLGNSHDLDYVLEKGGSPTQRGLPVAFIEIAWRRYTKQSRNKSGELEGALLPLRDTYRSTKLVGTILAGRYSEGGRQQLLSAGIEVLYIPFETVESAFAQNGISIDYPEKAAVAEKATLSEAIESLDDAALLEVARTLREAITQDFQAFESRLAEAITRTPTSVRIVTLLGFERTYPSVEVAIEALRATYIAPDLPSE